MCLGLDRVRAAMAGAPVGDDVYGDDPTVNELQRVIAERFGFETALSDAREALTEITGQPIEHFKGLAPDFAPTAPSSA